MDRRKIKRVLGYDAGPRLPRVGIVSVGEVGPNGKPRPLGYFRFSPVTGMERLVDIWVERFGSQPREFTATVHAMDLRREIWGRSKSGKAYLLHVCDGEHVRFQFNRETRRLERAPEGTVCDLKRCKPTLRVDLLIDGMPGIVTMTITGLYSINEIIGSDLALGLEGRSVRFFMTDKDIEVTLDSGKRITRTISVVHAWPEGESRIPAAPVADDAEVLVDAETGEILESDDVDTQDADVPAETDTDVPDMPETPDAAALPEYETLEGVIDELWG